MTLRTASQPCPRECGDVLVRSVRVSTTEPPVDVLCCFTCSYETDPLPCCPPIYDRAKDPRWTTCALTSCGKSIFRPLGERRQGKGKYCSRRCVGFAVNPRQYRVAS